MAAMERAAPAELPERKERSPWADATYQLMQNRLAVISIGFIIILVLLAVFADFVTPFDFAKNHLKDNYALPSATYWFGADNLGRDIFTRTIYGTRVSVSVAVIAATVSLGIGLIYGIVSGYLGGRVDELMMRFVDFLYGLPIIIVVILMQVFFKAMARSGNAVGIWGGLIALNKSLGGMLFIFIAIGALNWIGMARIARGQVLSYKEKEFIEAARSVGAGPTRIVFRHLLPNVIGPCIVQETLQIPGYILLEAFLSFIGLGVDAPTPSWGIMIQEGYQALRSYPHVLVAPAVALTLTVLAFNFLGDGLRDAFDPRLRGV
ncbi:MAG: ABC transporter permease [Chloroflexi bacterium]|nr:ABC transporter permease [Chloroflexota bacterium]